MSDAASGRGASLGESRLRFCLSLFASQLKIGLLTFGGGVAMIPFFHREAVDRRRWVSEEQFLDVLTTALSVPGPLAVTYSMVLGHRRGRLAGAVAGFVGIVTPSLVLVTMAALILQRYAEAPRAAAFLKGAGSAVVGLVAYAAYMLGARILTGPAAAVLAGSLVVAVLFLSIHPLVALLCTVVAAAFIDLRSPDDIPS